MAGDWGRGWGVYHDMHCEQCSATWHAVAPIGQVGCACPYCGTLDEDFLWEGMPDEHPNDGAWLTGENSLPVWIVEDEDGTQRLTSLGGMET